MKRRGFLSTVAALVAAPFLPKARTGSVLADEFLGPAKDVKGKFTANWTYYDGNKWIHIGAEGFHDKMDLTEEKISFPPTHWVKWTS